MNKGTNLQVRDIQHWHLAHKIIKNRFFTTALMIHNKYYNITIIDVLRVLNKNVSILLEYNTNIHAPIKLREIGPILVINVFVLVLNKFKYNFKHDSVKIYQINICKKNEITLKKNTYIIYFKCFGNIMFSIRFKKHFAVFCIIKRSLLNLYNCSIFTSVVNLVLLILLAVDIRGRYPLSVGLPQFTRLRPFGKGKTFHKRYGIVTTGHGVLHVIGIMWFTRTNLFHTDNTIPLVRCRIKMNNKTISNESIKIFHVQRFVEVDRWNFYFYPKFYIFCYTK
ncbi:hypothetical protein AGLY_014321 [Aphis glycines]|uniref:Uncharacterized protein n=1 Tax=Aphis glycines TaxID=307491 RepID=A0A6G0T3N6_APHGL|nr:hypothetical protein AGLY_014321 [Aphis glycines]